MPPTTKSVFGNISNPIYGASTPAPQQPTQATTTPQQGGIDPSVKALASTIGELETGASSQAAYTKRGASGEYGRYQFMPNTYKLYAKKYLGDENAQPTVENQNKIAYDFVNEKKQAGYNPAQILSMWNAGEAKPDAYKQNWRGTNSMGVKYDTPAYVQKGSEIYQRKKAEIGAFPGAIPQQLPDNPSFIQEASNQISKAGQGILDAYNNAASGNINPVSGVIQGLGAFAGGVGNLVNTSVEHLPVVGDAYKGLEGLVGQGVGALAQTNAGQGLMGAYQGFKEAHPELAGDLEAGVNIASLVPMGKGLSLLKGGAESAASTAFKSSLEKKAAEEIASGLTTKQATGSLARAEARGLKPMETIVKDKRYLPDVVEKDGRFIYDSSKGSTALNETLASQENELQNMLAQGVKKNVMVPFEEARAKMVKDMVKEFPVGPKRANAVRAVNELFDKTIEGEQLGHGRSMIDLSEFNDIKREMGEGINWGNLGVKSGEIKSAMYRSLMEQVEGYAKKAGVEGVHELNANMGQNIEALKILSSINGKAIKGGSGVGREIGRDVAGALGEAAGNTMGIPLAGTFAGRGLAGLVSRRLPKTAVRRLARTNRVLPTLQKGVANLSVSRAMQASTPASDQK